jgi:uncharacterized protein DUF7005
MTGELAEYVRNVFDVAGAQQHHTYPLPDEPSVRAWEEYLAEAATSGVFPTLQRRLAQLRFPIARGISGTSEYQMAVRRGVLPRDSALVLADPGALRLAIHATPAGRVPVIVAGAREDFIALVQALTRRNEPDPIPDAMGACIVGGYNNWDRVARLRAEWEAAAPETRTSADWDAAFAEIIPRRELYQDRFIVLSTGPYSAVPAPMRTLSEAEWLELSLHIRLEHECAHYFTRRVFGSMRNTLFDEIIADFIGLVRATGRFRAHWFLRFMGLEAYPEYRASGRLGNYRGDPPLTDAAFTALQSLVVRAARTLERFDDAIPRVAQTLDGWADLITTLVRVGFEGLSATDGLERLTGEWRVVHRESN